VCINKGKASDPLKIDVTVDTTPPSMQFVDDSSTLQNNTEFTWRTNKLRVKWLGKDNETKISSYLYILEEFGTLNTIVNWTTSFIENEFFFIKNLNLTNGAKYFFRVQARNIVGLSSQPKSSNGITINIGLKPTSCSNRIKDGQESDVDCGGPCDLCSNGKICNVNTDCSRSYCNANNVCAAPTCNDNVKNQDESDVDCGSSNCNSCSNGKTCNTKNDCSSSYCGFGICKETETCEDNKLTGTESDIDCGGACSNKCSIGKHCSLDNDCSGGNVKCVDTVCTQCAENDKNCNGISDDKENDRDGDQCPDDWEIQHGLDPSNPNDCSEDPDEDGPPNKEEYLHRTNPNKADTDGDGHSDKKEIDKGSDPLDPESNQNHCDNVNEYLSY